ncbi:MAG: hypothetical protein GX237_05425 [Clostridiales bacterium]|nr:hypothetical protein [Clostridiales bacterium]
MNLLYAEAGVKRKDTALTIGLRALMIIGVLVGLFLMFIGQLFSIIGLVLIVAVFFFYPKLDVEYEYVYVDGQIDFDRITGKSKRKTLLRVDFEQVEIMAPSTSHALDNYKNAQFEVKNFTSLNKDNKHYTVIANIDNKRMKVLFEPSEKMLDLIKKKSPRKLETY